MKIRKLTILSVLTFLAFLIAFSLSDYGHEAAQSALPVHKDMQENEGGSKETASASEPEKLNAGKVIMEHVTDNHSWHLWGHSEIPLPVILYNKECGFTLFSSGHFEHGHMAYNGYKLEEGKVVAVNEMGSIPAEQATINEETTSKIFDISITKNVAAMFISIILLLFIFTSVASTYTRKRKGLAPTGFQNAIEPIILFIKDDVIKPGIGEKKYEKYVPYLLTLFFFIWMNNMLGLIPIFPGGTNVTGNVSVTLTLAIFTFLIVSFSANKGYWQHVFFMPGVPKGILLLITPIEILGVFLRPFVLMIRLFANMVAGHIIILSFICLIFIFGQQNGTAVGLAVSPVTLLFTVFMSVLELLVAFLQAYVFTMLSAVYIGAAIEDHHHEKGHLNEDPHMESII